MPGISLIYKKGLNRSLVADSLADLKHEPYYITEKLIDKNNMMSAFSGYEGYPRRNFEYDNSVIFVEGLIFNKSEPEIESSLLAILKAYTENADYNTLITEFIDTSDGQFNVLIYSKSPEKFIIFNDRWGRLPSYFYYDDNMFIFSRELKLILHFIPSIELDRISIAEWLLFEFVLGERTLVKRLSKVSPSQVFNVGPSAGGIKVEVDKVFGLNFEDAPETLSRDECIEKCKNLLLQSTNDRVNKVREMGYNITADLSGGFDSRAVFGALCKTGAEIDYYTEHLSTGDESEYAINIAALFDKEVTEITASHQMNVSDMSKVIYKTDCGVNGWTALNCYQDEVERFKQSKRMSVQFTGLGSGEFIKRLPRVGEYCKTITNALKAGYLKDPGSLEMSCRITNLDEKAFCNHLDLCFDEYPEPTLNGKVRHWHFEYENKLVSLGEDRGRFYIWQVAPLWAKDLFSFITMHIPEKYVVGGFDYYFRFLKAIDSDLTNTPLFSGRVIINSRLFTLKDRILSKLKYTVLRISQLNKIVQRGLFKLYRRRTLIKDSTERERIKRDILENYSQLGRMSAFSDEKSICRFLDSANKVQSYCLMALVLYFREIESRYGDKVYIN